jgi:phage major head subunit gpT-like protein
MGVYTDDLRTINALSKTISKAFAQNLEAQQRTYGNCFSTVQVNTNTIQFPYVNDLGDGLNEWITGTEKKTDQLQGGYAEYILKDWEKTIQIRKRDIEDDNIGLYMDEINGLAEYAAQNDDKQIASILAGGDTGTDAVYICYDGENLFDNSHPSATSGTTYDNLLSGALASGTIESGIVAMMKFKGAGGRILNIVPDTIIVPPDLQKTATELVYSSYTFDKSNDTENYFKPIIKNVIVDARLTDANDWYLAKIGGMRKPFMKLSRNAPSITAIKDAQAHDVFYKGVYVFGLEERSVIIPGFWQYIIKFVNG